MSHYYTLKIIFCLCNLVFINYLFLFCTDCLFSCSSYAIIFRAWNRKAGMIIRFTSEGVELPVCWHHAEISKFKATLPGLMTRPWRKLLHHSSDKKKIDFLQYPPVSLRLDRTLCSFRLLPCLNSWSSSCLLVPEIKIE